MSIPDSRYSSTWQTLIEFSLSNPDDDQQASKQIAIMLHSLKLLPADLERLSTATFEAAINAGEHKNIPVIIRLLVPIERENNLSGGLISPQSNAGFAPQELPPSWSFFVIERMMDDIQIDTNEPYRVIELYLYLE